MQSEVSNLNLPARFEDLPPQERLRVIKAGSAMTHLVFRHAVPILISPPPGRFGVVTNGSGFLLRIKDATFLGTAWHVVQRWIERTGEGEALVFQIGKVSLNPNDRIAWKDEENDVVLFRVSLPEARQIGISVCEPVPKWPPPHPRVGAYVLTSGFPGKARAHPAADQVEFGALSTMLQVTAAGDRYVVCQFHREHWIGDGRDIPPPGSDLGGISGGPALLVQNLVYPLVGVLSEFSTTFELLYIKTLSHAPEDLT